MDIYGYSYFISLVIAPFPGLFISLMQKIYKSEKVGSHRALTGLLLLAIILGNVNANNNFFGIHGIFVRKNGILVPTMFFSN